MVQLFVTIIFIAEVIIAASLVFNIYKLNIKIINANDDVEAFKKTIKRSYKEIRFVLRVTKYNNTQNSTCYQVETGRIYAEHNQKCIDFI